MALIGLGFFTSGIGYAALSGGGFIVPEINDDFEQFNHTPETPKEQPINENAQGEKSGKLDWLTKPVKKGWQWLKNTGSKAWKWTKKAASAVWEYVIEPIWSVIKTVIIVVVYFVFGVLKALWDVVVGIVGIVVGIITFIYGMITSPKETWNNFLDALGNIWDAIVNIDDTLGGLWNSITESFVRDVINGDAKSRAEWFGYAAGQILLALIGTKGLDKAAKAGKAGRLGKVGDGLINKLPEPVQKVFSKETWKGWANTARSYFSRLNINWKNAAVTGTVGLSLVGAGFFVVPRVAPAAIKIIKWMDCFAYEQPKDKYFAVMILAKGNDKCNENIEINTNSDQYTIKVKTPKPLEPRGKPLKQPIEFKQEEIALKTYERLRATGLDKKEIETFAKNTGLSVEEAIQLKTHIFLTKHVNLADWKNGKYYYEGYFDVDIHIAYGWELALKRELTAEEKAWFRQLADHELAESKMMQEGLPYRDIRSFEEGKGLTGNPPGAHDLAPPQPGDFPGIKIQF